MAKVELATSSLEKLGVWPTNDISAFGDNETFQVCILCRRAKLENFFARSGIQTLI